jgi:hypothetical protein
MKGASTLEKNGATGKYLLNSFHRAFSPQGLPTQIVVLPLTHLAPLMGYERCWVWEPKGQMNEYPIPHGEHQEPCTLRRRSMVL